VIVATPLLMDGIITPFLEWKISRNGQLAGRPAADALINHGFLRATYSSDGRERTAKVRVREQIVRVFAVSKSILAWRSPSPARPDEILAARHAATMQHAMMQHASLRNGNGEQAAHLEASDLGEKLEQAVHMALNEVAAILGFSLDPDDRAFTIHSARSPFTASNVRDGGLVCKKLILLESAIWGRGRTFQFDRIGSSLRVSSPCFSNAR
jgi:hypothetical protein